jgi:hypothetical protein
LEDTLDALDALDALDDELGEDNCDAAIRKWIDF